MAVDIGKLSAKIVADASGFRTGLDTAEKHAKTWSKNMTTTLGSAMKFGAIGLGVGSAAGFFNTMKEHIKNLENVGDAAANAGVDIQTFMNVVGTLDSGDTALASTALEKLRKTMGELAVGDKGTFDKLLAAGFDPKAMQLESLETNLRNVAKAIMDTHDPALQAAKSLAIFGKAGIGLMEVMDKLAEGGVGPSRFKGVDAATMAGIAAMKEDITAVENMWEGTKTTWAGMMVGMKNIFQGDVAGGGRKLFGMAPTESGRQAAEIEQQMKLDARKRQQDADKMAAAADKKMAEHAKAFGDTIAQLGKKFNEGKTAVTGYVEKFADAHKKMMDDAKEMTSTLQTPSERFQAEIDKINNLKKTGGFGIGQAAIEIQEKLIAKAIMDLPSAPAVERGPAPQSLEKGSVEARSAITDFERRAASPIKTAAEENKEKLEAIRAESARQTEVMREVRNFLKENKQFVVK